ncbi:MFS transporter [Brachybacterium fresconis]|uniref:CP family cyanate transporter-like MFS transporter n=1 Tax=Brachybacterium fresconis TaxID=173363 RepID=A0ABS4YN66_9MICO|nr:CP family cyanate transporter-like MFS transporter [Brachybacterium fresconis]
MSTRSSPSTPPPAKGSAPSRAVAVGGLLGILAVGLVALNLRPGATSVGPLMEDIVGAYGQGAIASGLLTALPPLAFGILGFFAVPISRRVGLTGTVVASFVLVAVGLLLRPAAGGFGAFVALSLLVLVGPALGNVVVPAWIKQHGGSRTVGWMTLYSVVLAVGGSAGAALAVPLAGSATDGWRDSLQFWGLLAVLPVVVWAVVLTRTGHDFPPAPPSGDLPGSLLRSRTAIALTIMFGLQSTNAYTQFGMLPQILTSSGLTPSRAGITVAVVSGWGIVGGLVMPTVIARFRHLPWLVGGFGLLTTAGYLGFWLAPGVSPLLWACVLGIGGFAFPTAIALIPARSRSPRVTARLSGMAQPFGYVLAAIGPLAAGALLDTTGSIPAVLGFMALTGLALAVFGYRAALPRTVDDELTA